MKRIIRGGITAVFVFLALFLTAPSTFASATTSTITNTVTVVGWLVPDATHFANTYLVLIFPLVGLVIFEMPLMMFHRKGDIAVYAALGGMLAGSILSDLSSNGASTQATPFAIIVVAGILLFLWYWNS